MIKAQNYLGIGENREMDLKVDKCRELGIKSWEFTRAENLLMDLFTGVVLGYAKRA